MENKDLLLKLLCKTLFSKLGFVTHYEIKLRSKSYVASYKTHDISDIDVFGYRFSSDLSLNTIGSECKSGENNAIDELYKFIGIAKYYRLTRGYLIKTKVHQNARQIALENDFSCLTEGELRKLLSGFRADIEKVIKIENAKYIKQGKCFASHKNKNEKLVEYINLDFWNKENWKNIHNILHILKHSEDTPAMFRDLTIADKYVYHYVAGLFSFSVLRNSSEAMVLNYSDFDNAFISCLYGGAEAMNEKRRIHDAVNIATKENRDFEPEWQADLITICSRMSQATPEASLVPQLIQDLYENSFYDDKIKIDSRPIKRYPDLTRKFAQDIMQFLEKSCSLDSQVFSEFMQF